MRFPLLVLVVLSCGVCEATGQAPDRMHADCIIGHVTRTAGRLIETDLGYAHGFTRGQQLAVFRSNGIAWNPIGIVAMQTMGSNRTGVRVTNGAQPAKGDLLVVAQSFVGYRNRVARDDFYVRRRILFRRGQNGYDTRGTAVDTQQLFEQRKNSHRWYRRRDRPDLKLTYGSNREAYQSERVENLARQCLLMKEFMEKSPGAMKSLSARWANVLPIVTGYVEPPAPADSDTDTEDIDNSFATDFSKNLLPDVKVRFEAEPESVQEVFALLLGALASNPPANNQAYLRLRFKQTQFPQLAEQPNTLQQLDDFLATLN